MREDETKEGKGMHGV